MKARFLRPIALVGLFIAFMSAGHAHAQSISIALIPTVTSVPADDTKTFTLAFDAADDSKTRTATLTFDVQAIPAGATIDSAVLRLVPSGDVAGNQQVRIFANDQYTNSIGQLIASPAKPAVESTGTGLVDALNGANGTLDLYLQTSSNRTSQSYHSDGADTAANRPRLIVSWKDEAPPVTREGAQLRYRGNPDDLTPWQYDAQDGAMLAPLFGKDLILAGPVFRGDEILLIAQPSPSAQPLLYGIDWNGNQRWEYALPALNDPTATWKYLHVDEQGRLLAFRNDGTISLFEDFGADGPAKRTDRPVDGLLLSKRPAVSAGGMVIFRSDNGYAYSLGPAPGFDELWRAPKAVNEKLPPPVLSPRTGDRLVYVMGDEQDKRLLVFDAARGDLRFEGTPDSSHLSTFDDLHPPFVVAGTDHDWVLLSGFGESTGVLEGYTDFTQGDPSGWKAAKEGPVSRCVAPPTSGGVEQVIYCVQDGQFRGFKLEDGSESCASEEGGLSATSNLVADGAGNIYFWNETSGDSGVFYGFDTQCVQLFSQQITGLPTKPDGSDVLELRVGPNGVFYVTSDKQLFAIQPTRSEPVAALAADTRYTTSGPMALPDVMAAPTDGPVALVAAETLSFGNLQIPAGADVTCVAGESISFGAGFTVENGGVLRCAVGTPAR